MYFLEQTSPTTSGNISTNSSQFPIHYTIHLMQHFGSSTNSSPFTPT